MFPNQNPWILTCEKKQQELESIAQWASQVNLGRVRDFCRQAKYELGCEIDRVRSMEQNSGMIF